MLFEGVGFMKQWLRVALALALAIGCWTVWGTPVESLPLKGGEESFLLAQSRNNAADSKLGEIGNKIDLNNSNIQAFRQLRGFYPILAQKIILNAPYEEVEDVLEIPDLSDRQQERLQANLDKFTVTPPADVFVQGDDRFNNGVYN